MLLKTSQITFLIIYVSNTHLNLILELLENDERLVLVGGTLKLLPSAFLFSSWIFNDTTQFNSAEFCCGKIYLQTVGLTNHHDTGRSWRDLGDELVHLYV